MLRIFKSYRPIQVARFVKTLFRGRIYIKGVGVFEFDKGKLLLPSRNSKLKLLVMKEVNLQVDALAAVPA